MPPIARMGDNHVCPVTDPKPHVGGPLAGPGVPTVLVADAVIAVVGDICVCAGPPDVLNSGSGAVLAGDKPVVRVSDETAHGGTVASGALTVMAE